MHRTFTLTMNIGTTVAARESFPNLLRKFARQLEVDEGEMHSILCGYNVYDAEENIIGKAKLHTLHHEKYISVRVVKRK